MARINNNTASESDIVWIEDSVLDQKVDAWKARGFTLDSVIKTLRTQDFKLKVKNEEGVEEIVSISLGKLSRAWHAEIVELD